jgi:hypothetical protein
MSKEHGRQLGTDMTSNFMLMTLFSIVADMAENPEGLRTEVKKTLLDLTDDYNLSGILGQRFHSLNHIRLPPRACMTKCE